MSRNLAAQNDDGREEREALGENDVWPSTPRPGPYSEFTPPPDITAPIQARVEAGGPPPRPVRDPSERPIVLRDGASRVKSGWLARRFRLDAYGSWGLFTRARVEMDRLAVLLCLVFLYDLAAWTLLFNAAFHGGDVALDGWTIPAVVAGFLFARVVIEYESSFVTSNPKARVIPATILRIAVVAAAAVVQAQPIEVMFFRAPIARRIHEESVWLEAVRRAKQLEEYDAEHREAERKKNQELEYGKVDAALKTSEDQAKRNSSDATKSLTAAEASVLGAQRKLESARGEVANVQDSLTRAQARGAPVDDEDAQRRYWANINRLSNQLGAARQQVTNADTDLRNANAQREAAQKQVDDAKKGLEAVTKARTEAVETAADKVATLDRQNKEVWRRIEEYLRKIAAAEPGTKVPACSDGKPFEGWDCESGFRDGDYNFFERLRVLEDLRTGVAPRRPDGWDDALKTVDLPFLPKATPSKDLFRTAWYTIYAIALIIPALIIAAKFLLADELKRYYDPEFQKHVGNPEARRFADADDAVREGQAERRNQFWSAWISRWSSWFRR